MKASITGMQEIFTETETDKPAMQEQQCWRAWHGEGSSGRLVFSGPG